MTHITKNFQIRTPSPATPVKELGAQLIELGDTVDSALHEVKATAGTGEVGAGLFQLVQELIDDLEVAAGYRAGPDTARQAHTPVPGDMWQVTGGKLYSCVTPGKWRQHSGTLTAEGGALTNSHPVYYRSLTVTVPTVLAEHETLQVVEDSVGGRISYISVGAITRGAENTSVTLRHTQIANAEPAEVSLAWQIVSK